MHRFARSLAVIGVALWMAFPTRGAEAVYRPETGTWLLPVASPHLVGADAVEVLLPAAYGHDPRTRFRVLYVLPVAGAGGEHGNALHVIRQLGLHDRLQLICVQPLFERAAMPWYGNHASDPRMRYADHLIDVVLPAVESHYRTVPGRAGRLLVGFSKSGWGAVALLLGHGDVFDAAASFDAPLMFTGRQFGAWGTDRTYGTPDTMDANCPTALLRKHSGEFQDRPRLVIAGEKVFGTLNDRNALQPYEGPSHTAAFHDLADSLGVRHGFLQHGHGSPIGFPEHSWNKEWMGPVVTMLAQLHLADGATAASAAADVVVVGATPGGIAAAVAAARGGARVLLVEEQGHVGGVIAGGLSNVDNVRKEAIGGLFNEFKRRVVEHYATAFGRDSQQVKDCRGGNDFEPRVAEKVFGEMLAGERRIEVRLRHRLAGVQKDGGRLARIVVEDLASGGAAVEIGGKVFIDATYEGDLAALAGVPYRVGREPRGEYGEPLAGRIYMDMATKEVLPGSTGEGDRGIQAFTYRFPLTADPANLVPIEKPEGYDENDYRDLLADLEAGRVKRLRDVIQMRAAPNRKVVVNNDHMQNGRPRQSLDLAEDNWDWPDGTPATRDRIRRRYWTYCEGLLWFLQYDPRVPEAVRKEAGRWGLCKDEFPDHRHRPWQIYVREARRIVGEATFTARDTEPEPATGKPRPVTDAIALVEYGFDSHAVHKFDPAHPLAREGYLAAGHPPTQLPYGVVVPRGVDGLLVPVACSSSRLGYQTIRMEPVFMALGEACGIAATTAIAAGVEVRAVDVATVQKEIVARGGVIALEDAGEPTKPAPAAKLQPAARPRNIVFILADDHRHDLLGCAGHPFVETPGLDSLARDGVRFRNAFVTTSLCSPSRASILTGQYAHTHGVVDNTAGFRRGTVLFPELLRKAGYRTGFFGKWHIGETSDAPQPGFDRWVSFRGHGSYLPGSSRTDRPPAMLNVDGRPVPQQGYITDELTDYCLEWLADEAQEGRPFFAYLSHKGIHGNFQPAARHVGRYRDAKLPPVVAAPEKPDAASRKPLWVRNQRNSFHGAEFPYQEAVPLADLYRSQCEALLSVDESVARVRSWLADRGLADSTLIVYMGDNGFLWGEHGLIDKRTAYEESMRVPLLGVCPGVWPAGTVRDEMVAGIDVAPTFLAAAGIEAPATMAGRSFFDLAAGRAVDPPWRDRLLYEYFWEYTFPHTPTTFALRTTTHKFIQYHGIWDLDELYDLRADPREQRNLVLDPDQAATAESMRRALNALLVESGVASVPFSPKRGHGNSLRRESGSAEAAFPPEWIESVPATKPGSP